MSNIVQRVAGALGLAVLTAVLVSHQDQQTGARAALMSAGVAPYQGMAAQGPSGVLGLYNSVQLQSFSTAIADVLLLTAGTSAICILLALMMPTGRRGSAFAMMAAMEGGAAVDEDGGVPGPGTLEVNGQTLVADGVASGPDGHQDGNGATRRVRHRAGGDAGSPPGEEHQHAVAVASSALAGDPEERCPVVKPR